MNEISIEESNKIREKLGLPLLNITSEAIGSSNNPIVSAKERNAAEDKDLQDAYKDSKYKSKSRKRVRTLGQGRDEDAADFISRLNQKSSFPSTKSKAGNNLRDYTEIDLAGIHVVHDLKDLGHETVLTLKDTNVLDEDQDELQNQNIVDLELARKNIEIRKGKKAYNAYEAFEREELGLEKKILTQYDDLEGPSGFFLEQGGKAKSVSQEPKQAVAKGVVSLDYPKVQADDFYTKDEFQFKKKPKKSKNKFKKIVYEEDVVYEPGSTSNKRNLDNLNFVDDDDLQNTLSKVRKQEIKKNWNNPELLAAIVREQGESENEPAGGGIIISEISEFVQHLPIPSETDFESDLMGRSEEPAIEMEVETVALVQDDLESQKEESPVNNEDSVFETEDPIVADGLAATLKLLSRKGDLDVLTDEQRTRELLVLEREKWIKQRKLMESMGQRLSHKDEMAELHLAQQKYKNYRPDISLVYRDETGRVLSTKEAYKEMSHKFHGKGSGKNKKEKHLKKLQQELAMKQMNSVDSPFELNIQRSALIIEKSEVPPDRTEHRRIGNPAASAITSTSTISPMQNFNVSKSEESIELVQCATLDPVKSTRTKISFGLSTKRKNINTNTL